MSGCRAKTKSNSRSYKILGAADWNKLKYVFFLYPVWFSFLDMFSIFFHIFFNFVLFVSFLLLFFVIFVFSMIVCHHSCVFRLLLNGSFIFSPFPGNLCNFDKCSLIFFVFLRFCIHYLTSRSKFIQYYLLLCPSCFNLLLAVQKLLPMFHYFMLYHVFFFPLFHSFSSIVHFCITFYSPFYFRFFSCMF